VDEELVCPGGTRITVELFRFLGLLAVEKDDLRLKVEIAELETNSLWEVGEPLLVLGRRVEVGKIAVVLIFDYCTLPCQGAPQYSKLTTYL
jgi:hypothetical protein